MEGYERKWRGCTEEDWTECKTLEFLVDYIYYSAIWGDHPGVYIYIVHEHNVHLNYEL